MSKFFKQTLKKKILPALPLAGLAMLIFALCLNGPRPSYVAAPSVESSQMTSLDSSPDVDESSDSDDAAPSQNTANTYEEIHDEIDIIPHLIKKPFISFFTPPSDTLKEGLTLSKLPRPPRNQA